MSLLEYYSCINFSKDTFVFLLKSTVLLKRHIRLSGLVSVPPFTNIISINDGCGCQNELIYY